MSQSSTSRRRTTRRCRRARRTGSPPVRRLARSVRRRSMRSPRRSLLGAARAPLRRGELEARHQPVELRELARARARRSACARRRSSSLASASGTSHLRRRPRRWRRTPTARPARSRCGAPARVARPPLVGRCRRRSGRSSSSTSSSGRVAEDREEHGVEGAHLRGVGDEHRARGPVQARAARRAARASSAWAKRAERSGVTGTPASCSRRPKRGDQRRQVELDRLDPKSSIARTSCSRPAARTTSWSSPYLSTDPSVRSIAAASSCSTPSTSSAASQSIASAMPGGFCTSLARIRATASTHLHGQRLGRALHAPAHDLDLALGRRVVDPVVQAAALDRVVQVARAVGGEHDDRRVRGPDRAELRDRHRRLGEQLEQERLEVVVGAVDLVDQQHRRPRPGVLERAQQRPADQVVARRTAPPRRAPCRSPRRAGCSAAGAGSSTRTAPRRRRSRRSTAGGSAACRAPPRAPWRPRSCRPRPRPRAAAAAAGAGSGTSPSRRPSSTR